MSENTAYKVGIVGCGAIGTEVALAMDRGGINARLAGIYDIDSAMCVKLNDALKNKTIVFDDADQLISACYIVLEAAAVNAVGPLVESCAAAGKDLVVMSVGGIEPRHFDLFEKSCGTLYIPSGAVSGIDGILGYNEEKIESLTLTSIKPPAGFAGTPYLKEKGISLDGITEPVTIFEGSPAEAIRRFPKNINVSTTLALACGAPEIMNVRIVADPNVTVNTHEIRLASPLGNITVRVENKPSPSNPKTSALAFLSAIATIRKITSKVKIGS
jgi:aspartate dehydrogenase